MKIKYRKLNKLWLFLGSTALLSGSIVTYTNLDKNNSLLLSNLNVSNIIRNASTTSFKSVSVGQFYATTSGNGLPITYDNSNSKGITFTLSDGSAQSFVVQMVLNFQPNNIQQLSMQLSFLDSPPTQDFYNNYWKPNISTINNDFTNQITTILNGSPFVGSYKLSGLDISLNFNSNNVSINCGNYKIESVFQSTSNQLNDMNNKINTYNNIQIGLIVVLIIFLILIAILIFIMIRNKKRMKE